MITPEKRKYDNDAEAIAEAFRYFVPCNRCPFCERCEMSGQNCADTIKNVIKAEGVKNAV